ncbi:MAG: RIO1 family regulatory kinase/ATPase [Actinomycetota bacterium]|nr:serine/threonine protein kinase [Actinomycetota bacterium]
MTRLRPQVRAISPALILEDFIDDEEIGLLKSGKEADVYLVRRRAAARSCLLAAKRYVDPDERAFKSNARYFAHERGDGFVRDGGDRRRAVAGRNTQKAIDQRSRHGRAVIHDRWIDNEWNVLGTLWRAGVNVPYPVERLQDGILMEYVGDEEQAAPRLANARVERAQLRGLFDQLRENLKGFARSGLVHADLSPYNVLLWDELLWIIDVPQAVPYLENLDATEFLHRDVTNMCTWFNRKGLACDAEDLFATLLSEQFDYRMEDRFHAKGLGSTHVRSCPNW